MNIYPCVSANIPNIIKMRVEYRFKTFREAIAFYRFGNPARDKRKNIFEPESGASNESDKLTSEILYLSITGAIEDAKCGHSREAQECFTAYHIGPLRYLKDRSGIPIMHREPMGAEDLGRWYRVSARQVRRWVRRIEDDFEDDLIDRGLLPPRDKWAE
jgi:hypothetical protein